MRFLFCRCHQAIYTHRHSFSTTDGDPATALSGGTAGTTLAFATLFKLGQRSALLAPAAQVFPHAVQLLGSQLAANNALARQARAVHAAPAVLPLLLLLPCATSKAMHPCSGGV